MQGLRVTIPQYVDSPFPQPRLVVHQTVGDTDTSKQLWQGTDIYVVLSKNQVLLNPLVQHGARKELGEVSGCRTLHGIHTWRIPVSWTAWKPGDPRSIEMILHPAYPAMAHCHSSQGLLKSGIQPICCPPGYVARLPLNHVLEVWINTRNIAYNS